MVSTFQPSPHGDQNVGGALYGVALASVIIALIAVCSRTFVRARIVHALGWDDWIIILAIVLALIATVTEIMAIYQGLRRHGYYLMSSESEFSGKYSSISQAFCIMALTFCKVSVCICFLRIMEGVWALSSRLFLYTVTILVLIVNTAVIVTMFIQCQPTTKNWNPKIPGKCWNPVVQKDMVYLQGVVSALTDFLLSAFPFYFLKNLQMSKRSKTIVCILMGLGVITGVFTIVRTTYVGLYARMGNPSYTTINLLIWAALERNIAIAISCVPATRPLLASVTHLISDKASCYGGRQSHSKRSGPEDIKLSMNLSGAQGSQTFESPATIDHSTKSANASTRCESKEGIVPLHPVDAV